MYSMTIVKKTLYYFFYTEHVDKFQKSLEEEEIASKKVKKLPFV